MNPAELQCSFDIPEDSDFPLENIPFGVYSLKG